MSTNTNYLNDFIYYVKQQLNITINIHSNNEQAFIYVSLDIINMVYYVYD